MIEPATSPSGISARPPRIEAPTLLLAVAIYGGWLAATAWHREIPLPLLVAIGGWLIAWHGSLQHETIHGHPTGRRRIDDAIGFVPLALWLPYAIYRRSHLAHHGSAWITDPEHDPESRYIARAGGLAQFRAAAQSTLVGHLLLGPPLSVLAFLSGEARRALRDPAAAARDWLPHLVAVAALLAWLHHVGMPAWQYLLAFVYPGTALTLLRGYAEHRADRGRRGRAASVEHAGLLGLLYLNNNLHAAHHDRPRLPWYRLPGYHRRNRARFLGEGGRFYAGYGEVVRRFAFRPHDRSLHPRHEPAG